MWSIFNPWGVVWGAIPFAIAGSHGGTIAVCDMTVDPVKHQVLDRHTELRTVYADEGVVEDDKVDNTVAPPG